MGQAGVSTRVYKIPAKQMVQLVVDTLSADPLNVKTTIDPNGVIRTDWKEGYQGEYHIARYWQERSRFIATVVPDWQDPVGACRVDVVDDTEARSNPRAAWGEKTGLRRPERCKALIDAIDAKAASIK